MADQDFENNEIEVTDDLEMTEETNMVVSSSETKEGFLPEVTETFSSDELTEDAGEQLSLDGTELDEFEAADIEELEFVEEDQLDSIIESILFASDRPVSLHQLKLVFKGTNVRTEKIKRALDRLAVELAGSRRGVTLEEAPGGYQLRTKIDNMNFLTRTLKTRPFKISGPALEVLSIIAYKQPVIKAEIDEIRGVESGHLLRALMEKNLVTFAGKSDKPGRPMQYGTTRKFLEIFGLRSLRELPTLSQIDELLPEGINEDEAEASTPTLSQITDHLSQNAGTVYSEGEEELNKISDQLSGIKTSSEFFEEEKRRQKRKKEQDKAQGIREAMLVGESISTRDRNWLAKYDTALSEGFLSLEEFEESRKLRTVQERSKNEQFEAAETLEMALTSSDESDLLEAALSESIDFEEEDRSIDSDMGLETLDEEEPSGEVNP
jgi:segregation and condensation protein B